MHLTSRVAGLGLILSCFLSTNAQAMTCPEILDLLDKGTPEALVLAEMQSEGVDAGVFQCLTDNGAPAVILGMAQALESRVMPAKQAELIDAEADEDAAPMAEPEATAAPEPMPRPQPIMAPPADPAPAMGVETLVIRQERKRAKSKGDASRDYGAAAAGKGRANSRSRSSRNRRQHSRSGGSAAAPVAPARQPVGGLLSFDEGIGTEDYTDYGVNGVFLTSDDPLSTFAIDVDNASYTLSRAKLQGGVLPPPSAVRVEEFVNYFPYDDAPPTRKDIPFAVHMEAAPSPFATNKHLLRVGVKGRELRGERAPVHLTFLVDTSGSMGSANKLPLAKKALHELVDNLGVEDTVALATYAGSTRKVLGPTPVTRKGKLHDAIEQLSSGGGTAMSSGMEIAYQMASEAYLHGAENRVIVLSDGDANIGRTSHDEILRTIEHYAEEGITMTTVGFGMGNYKDTMMEQLSNKGDGNYYYIDSFNEAKRVFGVNLSGTLEVVAKDVKIQVEFDPKAVHAYRLIGYENRDIADRDFRNDAVDAGEIGSGHTVTALYELTLTDDAREQDIATVRLRAKKPGPDSPAREWETVFPGKALDREFADASADLKVASAVATFAELLRRSPHVQEVRYGDLHRIVKRAGRGFPEDRELLGLLEQAASLSGEGVTDAD